jgi:hypothetical protein
MAPNRKKEERAKAMRTRDSRRLQAANPSRVRMIKRTDRREQVRAGI